MKKLLFVTFAISISLSLTIPSVFWLAERVFFDRLLYQKSWLHGYDLGLLLNKGMEEKWSYLHRFLFNQRQTDLKLLLQESKAPSISRFCPAQKTASARYFTKQHPLTIAVIGDSNAYGMGVRTEQRFSYQLEQLLNDYVPTKVYTLAEPGNDFVDMFSLYVLAKDYLQVDFVVFGVMENDFMINDDLRYPNSQAIKSALAQVCGSPDLNKSINFSSWSETLAKYYPYYSPHNPNYCSIRLSLSQLRDDNKIVFIRYFNFDQPLLCAIDSKDSNQCLHKFMTSTYSEMITENHLPIIGLNPSETLEPVSELEGHPSARQHQLLATLLSSHIIGHVYQQKNQLPNN